MVLFVADLLHPIDDLPIELFLNGDTRRGRCRRRAMPVLFPSREPHHITREDRVEICRLAIGAQDRFALGLAFLMKVEYNRLPSI
jgi:hypothetical protein